MNMSSQKGFANIVLVLIVVALVGVAGYFVFVKKSEPVTQQTTPTPTQTETSASQTSTPKVETTGQFEGSLRKGTDNTWSLLMSFGKEVALYPLKFTSNSICVIGPDEGPCSTLQSNFNKGIYSPGGGDAVSVSGNKQGSTITVNKLILIGNFVMNGNLVETTSGSGQKMWSLAYQPPVGDSVTQNPNRPTNTIPLKFDEKSFCGDTGEIKCALYTLHQNDWVFVRGVEYKDVLIVRMLTIPAKAPSTLPR